MQVGLQNEEGSAREVTKHKARIVTKGYSQIPSQDFDETYSPIARLTSLRILVTIAATENLEIGQMDVVSAFLNGRLDKPIFMQSPPGYALKQGCNSVRLLKALYGLKQAGRTWRKALDNHLTIEMKFARSTHDWGVDQSKERRAYLIVYVDDLLIAHRRNLPSKRSRTNSPSDGK